MNVISPTVIALVLWFLFFALHAFAAFKSHYPTKAEGPDQIIIISDSSVGPIAERQVNQTEGELRERLTLTQWTLLTR